MSDTEPIELDDDEGLEVDLDDVEEDDENAAGDEEPTAEQLAKIQAENLKLRKENQRNRERYQPIERIFAGIDEEDAVAIARFAQTYAAGNRAEAVKWLAHNAVTLAGDELADVLVEYGFTKKEAKEAAKKVDAAEGDKPLTADEVAKMIAAERARDKAEAEKQWEAQQEVDGYLNEIDSALNELGITPLTDEAEVVVAEANRMFQNGTAPDSIPDLIAEARRTVLKRSAAFLQSEKARREKNAKGAPGPDGPAPRTGTDRPRVERIAEKLAKDAMSRVR